jgi:hypothetical protein
MPARRVGKDVLEETSFWPCISGWTRVQTGCDWWNKLGLYAVLERAPEFEECYLPSLITTRSSCARSSAFSYTSLLTQVDANLLRAFVADNT